MGDASSKQMDYLRSLWTKAVRRGLVEEENAPAALDPFNPQTPSSREVSREIETLIQLLDREQ